MRYQAILLGMLLVLVLTAVMIGLALLAGATQATGPQLLTASALWILAGFLCAKSSREAGMLHALIAGLLGALLIAWLVSFMVDATGSLLLKSLATRPLFMFVILGGFWGSVGGMIWEIVRVVKLKKAAKRSVRRE
jgi:uncharacterized integral membrane protein